MTQTTLKWYQKQVIVQNQNSQTTKSQKPTTEAKQKERGNEYKTQTLKIRSKYHVFSVLLFFWNIEKVQRKRKN